MSIASNVLINLRCFDQTQIPTEFTVNFIQCLYKSNSKLCVIFRFVKSIDRFTFGQTLTNRKITQSFEFDLNDLMIIWKDCRTFERKKNQW